MTNLDLSKLISYDFIYNYIDIKYKNNYELSYCDTDSFVMKLYTDDIYKDMIIDS